MRFTARAVLLVSIPLLLAACATGPNPIVARDPLPPPPPGYQVVCDTARVPFYLYQSTCRPDVAPTATALQVRG